MNLDKLEKECEYYIQWDSLQEDLLSLIKEYKELKDENKELKDILLQIKMRAESGLDLLNKVVSDLIK